MTVWLQHAIEFLRIDDAIALITVCSVDGSAPREIGAKMIVTNDRTVGTIGGGALEFTTIARARALLADDENTAVFEDYPLGPQLGQCCGGKVRIGFERLTREDLDWLSNALDIYEQDGGVEIDYVIAALTDKQARRVFALRPQARHAPAIQFLDASGAALEDSAPPLEDCHALREVLVDDRPRVYVFGAGHVGREMIDILGRLPVAATWIDRRSERLKCEDEQIVQAIATDNEVDVVAKAPAGAYYFVLTHSHQLDYDLVHAILKRRDSAYCGLIGSQTKRSRFERRLRRAGVSEAALQNLICPIGGGGLKSKDPAVIALSAIHEVLLAHEAHLEDA